MSALSLWAPASILLLLASPEPRLMQLAPDAAAGCLLLLRMLSGRLIVLALVPVVLAGQLAGLRLADRVAPAGAASQRLVIVSLCGVPRTQGRMSRLIARPHDPILPRRLALGWFDAPPDLQAGSVWQLLLRVRADRGLHGAGVDRERRGFAQGIGARASVRRSALNRPLSAAT